MRRTKAMACLVLLASTAGWALTPPEQDQQSPLASRAFFKQELYIPIHNMPLEEAQAQMSAQSMNAWANFFARHGNRFNVYMDPRSGTPTSVQGSVPLIPGKGVGNNVSLASVGQQLGRPVSKIDQAVVADLVVKFVADNQAALGVDLLQLGEPRVTQVTDFLWQVHIPQQVQGVPVRHGRLAATINHGNLILLGTEAWGNVQASIKPMVTSQDAVALGNLHAGLIASPSELWMQPTLEIAPMVRTENEKGQTFIGTLGHGYEHRLVWSYGFERQGEYERWRMTVDAQTGEVLAMEDTNNYFTAGIKGGIYPSTNIEICTDNARCGVMQPNSPMPWANTGLAAPNNFTNGAGVYDFTTGTATTTLDGRYVRIVDTCGAISFSSTTGDMDLGGTNGQHDCTIGNGGGPGNTPASRSAFYEVNKLAELARGWLPTNTWLQNKLTANVNLNSTCNAFWNGTTINFYKSGGGCRNTGEIGAVFDHEWGHGLDDNDANGTLSNSSEGYADIAGILRLQASCVGYGFWHTSNRGCGQTPDGTGYNQNESQVSSAGTLCNLNCSGVRDADWGQHAGTTPSTPQNFVCSKCTSSSGPCGRQVHCAASPARQAAWDLVTRDLTAAPFNMDSNTAFITGNKLFYQGSGNIGTWHACDCTAGTSDGCGATNGYMQWLAADDDNGNLNDGTPHMTAIYAAYNRHNIACATPARVNAGCSGGPTAAPTTTATPGDGSVGLSWTTSSGATQYWVMKTEGFAGCDFSKAKIATATGTTYTDNEVANGRQYCYSIVPASSNTCFGAASTCVCATPVCAPPTLPTLARPTDAETGVDFFVTFDWDGAAGSLFEIQVATDAAFSNIVRQASGLNDSTWTLTQGLPQNTLYHWRVRSANSCGGTSDWSPVRTFTTRTCAPILAPTAQIPADGATNIPISPTLDWSDVQGATLYEVELATDVDFTNVVRSGTGLVTSSWLVSPPLLGITTYYWRARGTDSICGNGAWSAPSSFTTVFLCNPVAAAFDTARQAPTCGSVCGCDTGTLANGRGNMSGGVETNQPNSVNDSCPDGSSGAYHFDESIDQVVLKTTDEGILAANKQIRVDVTVWCYSASDKLDLFYTTNPVAPVTWTPLVTNLACTGAGTRTFTHMFNLGATAGQHAVRAQLRYGGTAGSACVSGSYNDRDDIVFTVTDSAPQVTSTQKAKQVRGRSTAR